MTMTLQEAVAFVRQVRPAWREGKGRVTAQTNAEHVIRILGGDLLMTDITPFHYLTIQNCLKAEGKANATINRVTASLSTVFTELKKHDLIEKVVRNPNNMKEPKGRSSFYTKEECEMLIAASLDLPFADRQEVHDALVVSIKTGMRKGELLKLRWEDINFDEGYFVLRDTKTGADRVLPLLGSVREVLERKYNERISDGEIFLISKDALLHRLRKLQKMVGITDTTKCWHTIRHSAATELFRRGAALPEVMEVLGHSTVETTMRYAKATLEGKTKALEILDD